MSMQHGHRIDGIASLEDLRGRCVVDDDSGCWHLRTARGRPMPIGVVHRIWIHGLGSISAPRGAWQLAYERTAPRHKVVMRCCTSYDCVAKDHLKLGDRAAVSAIVVEQGKFKNSLKRTAANRATNAKKRKLTWEQVEWARESEQSASAAAYALGVATNTVVALRARITWTGAATGSSVWAMARDHAALRAV